MADRAFLLIADIGGYTRFMKYHTINLAHAQDVVAQLLEAVIDAAEPVFTLSKLEGDAAFFYATLPPTGEPDFAPMAQAIARIRTAFLAKRGTLDVDRWCSCDGCVQVTDLTLKFVAHAGEVYFQKVRRMTELAGVDVIVVHRLLKNSVPIREYVLMTEPIASKIPAPVTPGAQPTEEDLEGIGKMQTYYADLTAMPVAPPAVKPRSELRSFWKWIGLTLRTLPFLARLKKPMVGYKNFPGP